MGQNPLFMKLILGLTAIAITIGSCKEDTKFDEKFSEHYIKTLQKNGVEMKYPDKDTTRKDCFRVPISVYLGKLQFMFDVQQLVDRNFIPFITKDDTVGNTCQVCIFKLVR
jgi:hypothetical protein